MSVYVDPLSPCLPNARWHHRESCHLYADTLAELHAMAERIGLKWAWFQSGPGPGKLPHYDLTSTKRKAAIAAGAIETDRRHIVEYGKRAKAAEAARKDGV